MPLLPTIPLPLTEAAALALGWPQLRNHIAQLSTSPLGRAFTLALEPSASLQWIESQQDRTAEIRGYLTSGSTFDFSGLFDPTTLLDKSRLEGAALEPLEILALLALTERVAAWRTLHLPQPGAAPRTWPAIAALTAPLLDHNLAPLLQVLRGKIEPDGTLSDDASPELRRIRRAMERQHRAIEESLRKSLARLSAEGRTQEELITVRGERFVIPVKSEFRRRVPGVVHGSSSSGQTVFVEPLETIEQNNELIRLLDEEQSEIHRILVLLTHAIGEQADPIYLGTAILAEVESHFARARFANDLQCIRPRFAAQAPGLELVDARHPLLELRLRAEKTKTVPLTLGLADDARQLILSGPNTGGKTVALKTTGLLALMAQAGLPVPAESAALPLFSAIYADIGDAQSIDRNLSSFSAHILNLDRIARIANSDSLVLLDELGSATDPEEGAALAVAIGQHFLEAGAWTIITTHLTALKVYAASRAGVLNAAVGFDPATLSPTYSLRLGVPGASAGLNIAERLGLDAKIILAARANLTTQAADIAALLNSLHAQLIAATTERESLQLRERELARERLRLETEGRAEQKARTKALEATLHALIANFESQLRDIVKSIDDKALARRIERTSATSIARARREFTGEFNTAILTHTAETRTPAPSTPAAIPHAPAPIRVGDLVQLKSLNRQARVDRILEGAAAPTFEVSIGPMKMRVPLADISPSETIAGPTPLEAARRRGGITIQTTTDSDYLPSEINVIGRTADEAHDEVARFLDRAFLAGLPRIRIVHGTGMGVLRRTLREYLKSHPHVTTVSEPPHNQGGQGATEVELRQ